MKPLALLLLLASALSTACASPTPTCASLPSDWDTSVELSELESMAGPTFETDDAGAPVVGQDLGGMCGLLCSQTATCSLKAVNGNQATVQCHVSCGP